MTPAKEPSANVANLNVERDNCNVIYNYGIWPAAVL